MALHHQKNHRGAWRYRHAFGPCKRGHPRTLPNGRITFVRPYPKGKDRKNPDALISKEYKFVEDKINLDTEITESKSGL